MRVSGPNPRNPGFLWMQFRNMGCAKKAPGERLKCLTATAQPKDIPGIY